MNKKQHDKEKIFEYLKSGHSITFDEAKSLFGTNSLRERIRDLRDEGYHIPGTDVKNENTGRWHRVYRLLDTPLPVVFTERKKQLCFIG